MKLYKTRDGDVLDEILWRHYGRNDLLIPVLEANRHRKLSFQPEIMLAGVIIELPEFPNKKQTKASPWS